MKCNLRPHKTLVLIEVEQLTEKKKRLKDNIEIKPENTLSSGIILATSDDDFMEEYEETTSTNRCRVIRVGNKVEEIQEGDYCLFTPNAGAELTYGEKSYRLIKEDDIQIIIEEAPYS